MNEDPDVLLDRIKRAYRAMRYDEAIRLTDALHSAIPEHPAGWVWRGIIAMSQGRFEDAVSAFSRRNEIGRDPWVLCQLGLCYWKLGRLDESGAAYAGALSIAPSVEACCGLATVLHGLRRFDEALAQLDIADGMAGSGSSPEVELRRGCTLFALKRFEEAAEAFARSVAVSPDFIVSRLIAFDRETLDSISAGPVFHCQATRVLDRGGRSETTRGVVLVSCNPPYARKYGFPFLRSYAEQAQPDHRLHVHVYDPDPTIVDEIDAVAAKSGIVSYAVTVEESPLDERAVAARKAYYASGRFMLLPSLLADYGVPILSLDIDFIVERPLGVMIEAHSGVDLVLDRRRPINSPWLDVAAGVVVVYPTKAAVDYLSKVGAYAAKYLLTESNPWLIDQAALSCVLAMLERFSVPPKVVWTEDAHKVGLWHIGHGYDRLLNDPRFMKYV